MKILLLKIFLPCFLITTWAFTQEKNVESLKIDQQAPDFSLVGVDDKTYTLEDFKKIEIVKLNPIP